MKRDGGECEYHEPHIGGVPCTLLTRTLFIWPGGHLAPLTLKFRKNRSRTHVRELQLFARNLHKNVLQKYFLWSNQKKVVKTEKKLDQILKNLMKNLIQIWFKFEFEKISNSSQTHLNLNLNNFSNWIQIWIRFESNFWLVPSFTLRNLNVCGLGRYIILNRPSPDQIQILPDF